MKLPRHAEIWFPSYLSDRARSLLTRQKPQRLWVSITDHYEPLGGRVSMETALRRVARWQEAWPRIADAAPRDVKELVFRAAKRLAIETILVANQRLQTPAGNPLVSAVRVDGGADVADQYIATHASAGDLVITQDVPLAALLVPKAVAVLDPRGDEHTVETVGERLSVRDFMEQARIAGIVTGGPPPYDARAKQAFAAALDRVLTRLRRSE